MLRSRYYLRLLLNCKVHHRIHKIPPLDPNLGDNTKKVKMGRTCSTQGESENQKGRDRMECKIIDWVQWRAGGLL
jgi:hypothetical protein